MTMRNRQQGIALMQVLLMVGIISILLLIMMHSTRQHLNQVDALQQQLDQHFELYSVETDLQFALLTTNISFPEQTPNEWSQQWNFYGKPFQVGDYQVELINLKSLVGLNRSPGPVRQLLMAYGASELQANRMVETLNDWQTVPELRREDRLGTDYGAGLPIQHLRELESLPGWDHELVTAIEPWINAWEPYAFNPAYAPDALISVVLTDAQFDILQQMRAEERFSRQEYMAITGDEEDEFTSYLPGPEYRIIIRRADEEISLVRVTDGVFAPHQRRPVQVRRTTFGY